jgi:hypothetical protein
MGAAPATILLPGRAVAVTGEAEGDALWLGPVELARAAGWKLTPLDLGG